MFRKPNSGINIDYILCRKYSRKLDSGSAFSYMGKYYQLVLGGKPASTISRSRIKVMLSKRIGIKAEYSGKVYSLEGIEKLRVKGYVKVKKDRRLLPKKPAANHPWRSGNLDRFKNDPGDEEIAIELFSSTIAWKTDNY